LGLKEYYSEWEKQFKQHNNEDEEEEEGEGEEVEEAREGCAYDDEPVLKKQKVKHDG